MGSGETQCATCIQASTDQGEVMSRQGSAAVLSWGDSPPDQANLIRDLIREELRRGLGRHSRASPTCWEVALAPPHAVLTLLGGPPSAWGTTDNKNSNNILFGYHQPSAPAASSCIRHFAASSVLVPLWLCFARSSSPASPALPVDDASSSIRAAIPGAL